MPSEASHRTLAVFDGARVAAGDGDGRPVGQAMAGRHHADDIRHQHALGRHGAGRRLAARTEVARGKADIDRARQHPLHQVAAIVAFQRHLDIGPRRQEAGDHLLDEAARQAGIGAHHDAAGMRMDPQVLDALEKAAAGEKGQHRPDKRPI